jgi:hypothetical protein
VNPEEGMLKLENGDKKKIDLTSDVFVSESATRYGHVMRLPFDERWAGDNKALRNKFFKRVSKWFQVFVKKSMVFYS